MPKTYTETASVGAVTETTSGDQAWTNPDVTRLGTSNNVYATNSPGISNTTHRLTCDQFGISLPAEAKSPVNKVESLIEFAMSDANASLVSAMVKEGTPTEAITANGDDTQAEHTWIREDTAGAPWTKAEVEASDSGVAFAGVCGLSVVTFSVDHVQFRVTYEYWERGSILMY